ncbi:MAG: SMP-30/gluconolactonase/LRE family protein [Burkholderiaceae bacterium]
MSAPALLLDGLAFAEAPRWHDGALWFSDFFLEQVLRVDAQGRTQVMAHLSNQPSGLGWAPDGRLLVVSMLDHKLMRLDPAGLVMVSDLGAFATGPCNDMVVDARGGAYIGNFGFDLFAEPIVRRSAALVYVSPDGVPRVAAEGLEFPNGAVITSDGRTLIVAETYGRRLTAFRIGADGSLHERRVWADLIKIAPDGICLDAEGAVWVASPRTNEFIRVLEGGAITDRIACEQQAIACALGGTDGRRLFMVGGKVRPREPSLAHRAGRITWVDVAVPAAAPPA